MRTEKKDLTKKKNICTTPSSAITLPLVKDNLLGGSGAAVEFGGDSRDLSLQVVVGRVDLGLVLDQEGAEDAVVDGDSALFDGQDN